MPSDAILKHLRDKLAGSDPWAIESNPFERLRYETTLDLLNQHGPFDSGLEIGCAAGVFSLQLAERCARLRIADLMPQAITRCRRRLRGRDGVVFSVADIADCDGWGETYDLIVLCEVLYYLDDDIAIERTVTKVAHWLRTGGVLVFGSATDAATRSWGLAGGAETAMAEWSKTLREVGRVSCRGAKPDERAVVVAYVRDA
jgi:2-polyprenyl-3-methyl-5-hydroxy-6-metoxy-1,4-benzoquinol methylase